MSTVMRDHEVAAERSATLALWFPQEHRQVLRDTCGLALLFCVGYLLLPRAGTDLAAQVARGHFFDEYGGGAIDFRWYGGTHPFGYSLLTGPANAIFGSRGVGAIACVLTAVGFTWFAARVGVRRPAAGGVACVLMGVFNLVSGRTTFALGVAFGILALCALVSPMKQRARFVVAMSLAFFATAASPVAGAFVVLVGAACLLAFRWREGIALAIGASIPMLPLVLLFRDGGRQPFLVSAMWDAFLVCLITFFLIPRRYRALQIGVVLAAAAVVVTYLLPTPMGSNIVRLPMFFAIPIVVAVADIRPVWLTAALTVMVVVQPPLMMNDLARAGEMGVERSFFQPLIDELKERRPIGRIEVVPLSAHWESVYIAEVVPLARGWMRQVDTERNPLFYDNSLDAETYRQWLLRNAVEYVALPRGAQSGDPTVRDARLDWAAGQEAALVGAGLPYLTLVWHNEHWKLYRVEDAVPIVDEPARLLESGPTGVRFWMPAPGVVRIRVHWSQWLIAVGDNVCIRKTPGQPWVEAIVSKRGEYALTSKSMINAYRDSRTC